MVTVRMCKAFLIMGMIWTLAACLNNQQDEGGRTQTNDFRPYGVNERDMRDADGRLRQVPRDQWGNRMFYRTGLHNNSRIELSQNIAEAVAEMDQVKSAIVFLTDENAYVAVTLAESPNPDEVRTRTSTGKPVPGNRMTMADDPAARIKSKIADKVRSMDPSVGNVFVSANPDFVDRMNGFAHSLKSGKAARGFMDEFNLFMERTFPVTTGRSPQTEDGTLDQPPRTPNNIPGSNGLMNR